MLIRVEIPKPEVTISGSFDPLSAAASPRQRHLQEAAVSTLDSQPHAPKRWESFKQPLPLILQIFQGLTEKTEDFWQHAAPYFQRKEFAAGTVLFSRGERSAAFYLLQVGMLRAAYYLPVGSYQESIVAGTTCGELPFFSKTSRTATVVAERDSICWCLDEETWEEMQLKWPEGAHELLGVALKLTKERVDAVTSYVLTTAG